MTNESNSMKIEIRIKPSLKQRIKEAADDAGLDISSWVRSTVIAELKRQEVRAPKGS